MWFFFSASDVRISMNIIFVFYKNSLLVDLLSLVIGGHPPAPLLFMHSSILHRFKIWQYEAAPLAHFTSISSWFFVV